MDGQSKFKQVLIWSGTALAIISAIIYIAIVYVLVKGFNQTLETSKLLLFVILGAVVGILITMSLRVQGIAFARQTKESQEALKELRDLRSKNTKKRIYSITFYTFIQFFFFSFFDCIKQLFRLLHFFWCLRFFEVFRHCLFQF